MNKVSMKLIKCLLVLPLVAMAVMSTACSDGKSYADLLSDENKAVNFYLADHKVINEIPADSIFEEGPDAPFYRMDEDGQVYMQVIKSGNLKDKAYDDQVIYFRFMRYNLLYNYTYNEWPEGEGNAESMEYMATSFRYGNYTLTASAQYGSGIQVPLAYLGVECEVNIVIKSQYGFTSELSNVVPYMFNVRYFKSRI